MSNSLLERVLRHRNKLPREDVCALPLVVIKFSLDGSLNNLVMWKLSLPTAEAWN